MVFSIFLLLCMAGMVWLTPNDPPPSLGKRQKNTLSPSYPFPSFAYVGRDNSTPPSRCIVKKNGTWRILKNIYYKKEVSSPFFVSIIFCCVIYLPFFLLFPDAAVPMTVLSKTFSNYLQSWPDQKDLERLRATAFVKGDRWWTSLKQSFDRSCKGFPLISISRPRLKMRTTVDEARDARHKQELAIYGTTLVANLKLAAAAGAHPAGIFMAAAPPAPPPKPTVDLYQPMKEEEYFMELIFPGYFEGAFIWHASLVQIAMFGVTMLLGHNKSNPTPCALYQLGASWGPAVASGQIWRLFCPMLLHANMMHLFFNIFFQLRIGFGMEKQFGRKKMQWIYLLCGVIGNLVSISLDPFKLAVGASTAGFGLIGVWFAEILLSWELMGPNKDRTLVWIIFMLISVTSMSSMTPNMDLFGHLGGALGGFLVGLLMADMNDEHKPAWYDQSKRAAFIALIGLITVCTGKVGFFTPTTPLPNCGLLHLLSK
eukprot:GEMP01027164.1.p1 GENE.GEMP01027164.1~~GEMP01027164.1.p1  ORF type:complete len:483 (-),score=71.11 GEMP01027164.1:821-2269(-)